MRICLVGPVYPFRGGIAHHTTALAESARRAGHTLQVVSFRRQYPAWLYPGKTDRDPSQRLPLADTQYILDPLNPVTWIKTAQVIQVFEPDVVVFQWWNTYWAPPFAVMARLLRERGIKVIFLVHNVLPHEERGLDRWLSRITLGQARDYIVQSEREQKRLEKLLPGCRTAFCPHPVYDLPLNGPALTRAEARRQLGLPADAPCLLFFGIIRPYKGLAVLLDALGLLKERAIAPHLLAAGECWGGAQPYEQQIERLGLTETVHLEDRYIPDERVPLLFSAAELFVAPYLDGTQSGAIKLAVGAGLPLILTEPLVTDAFLASSPAVKVVPPGNALALAEAIADWLAGKWVPGPMQPPQDGWQKMVDTLVQLSGNPD